MSIVDIVFGIFLTFKYLNLGNFEIPITKTQFIFDVQKDAEYKIYIQFKDYYQNYYNYSKSISFKQLKGKIPENLDSCKPFIRNNNKIIYPCGLIANSFPQFKILIDKQEISDSGIIWNSQKNFIKPTSYDLNDIIPPISWSKNTDLKKLNQNKRFVNWINIAAFDNFRKLHGKIFLKKGNHTLNISSNKNYQNIKIVFAETSSFGVRNIFLSLSLIALGIFSLVSSVIILYKSNFNISKLL
ncbi:Cdc 50, partial [Tubulinosema ratisbonensis]